MLLLNSTLHNQRRIGTTFVRCLFAATTPVPPDPILGLVARFQADTNPNAVNLAQGAYRNAQGRPFVLSSVKKAEKRIADELSNNQINKEYLGIEGNPAFLQASAAFAWGEIYDQIEPRVASVQSLSGTGALRLAADTLHQIGNVQDIWLSNPSWGNHAKIFEAAGLTTKNYQYLNPQTGTSLDFERMCHDLTHVVPDGSVVLLHACAHNPTGIDPTNSQWDQLADVFEKKHLIPLFDSAYQGYASGNPDVDAYAIRAFTTRSNISTMLVCQSYAKNMGMYGERVGALNVLTNTPMERDAVLSQIKQKIIRPMYSSPPLHGSRLANLLLTDEALNKEWLQELKGMATRIEGIRKELVVALDKEEAGAGGGGRSWHHITDQIGMFAYTGLSGEQVDVLLDEHGIYLTRDGRMSLAGMKSSDVDVVAKAMVEVVGKE
jgi:aspartate aminotransferase